MDIKPLLDSQSFSDAFFNLCRKYDHCELCVAWCGAPTDVPFSYLKYIKVRALVGVDLYNTNPTGLRELMGMGCDLRIVKRSSEKIFHPKIYIFTKNHSQDVTVIIGSANFSNNGFNYNEEANVIITGAAARSILPELIGKVKFWRSEAFSFEPTASWLNEYSLQWKNNYKKRPKTPLDVEKEAEKITGWILNLPWKQYYAKIQKNLPRYGELGSGPALALSEFKKRFHFPLRTEVFESLENRRILLGEGKYGTFGHIGASGKVKHLFAKGTEEEKRLVVNVLNNIHNIGVMDYPALRKQLERLETLGITMRSWGRLLTLVRPDLFFTVSSENLRASLAKTLKFPKGLTVTAKGYTQLAQAIHRSAWFKEKPGAAMLSKEEQVVFENRVAYLDVIFYWMGS